MEEDILCGVYIIRNKITSESYIGSSIDIDKRWEDHLNLLRNGHHHSANLQKSYNKYGEGSFEFSVLLVCDEINIRKHEKHLINTASPKLNGKRNDKQIEDWWKMAREKYWWAK